jgi:hypothetical protein
MEQIAVQQRTNLLYFPMSEMIYCKLSTVNNTRIEITGLEQSSISCDHELHHQALRFLHGGGQLSRSEERSIHNLHHVFLYFVFVEGSPS